MERLSDVEARLRTVDQLSAVIAAMRAMAAARSREALARLDGIRRYAGTIGVAIGEALALVPDPGAPPATPARADGDGHAVVALCAEHGFTGVFSEHVLAAAEALLADRGRDVLFIVGDRGRSAAAMRDLAPAWTAPMIGHAAEAPAVAARIAEALYERLEAGTVTRVSLVHARPGGSAVEVVEKRLVPFDFARFPPAGRLDPPLVNLAPRRLVERLAQEYIFAELAEAVTLSFAAENEARTRAMLRAHDNVAQMLGTLGSEARQLRQSEITAEIAGFAVATLAQSRER